MCLFIISAISILITILRLPNVEAWAASNHENFQILIRFICFCTYTNPSTQMLMTWGASGMQGTWFAWFLQPRVANRANIVMKSETVQNTTYKTHKSKTFEYLIMKNIWIEKIAKRLSHSIYTTFLFVSFISRIYHNSSAQQLWCMAFCLISLMVYALPCTGPNLSSSTHELHSKKTY